MISAPEVISVHRKARSFVSCEATPGKTVPRKAMPGKPAEMAGTSEMPTATKMAAATEMATATAKAATAKAATSSTMAAASSTMGDRCDGRERHNAGQN